MRLWNVMFKKDELEALLWFVHVQIKIDFFYKI